MDVKEDSLLVLEEVLDRLPLVPKTTDAFLYPASAPSTVVCAESVVSGGRAIRGSHVVSSIERALHPGDVCPPGSASAPGPVSSNAAAAASESSTRDVNAGSVVCGGSVTCSASSGSGVCISTAETEKARRYPQDLPERALAMIFRLLPIKDIFRVGYLLSKKWLEVWQGMPLVLHDVQIARDKERERIQKGSLINLGKGISLILDRHPGPVELLRVDSSTWPGNSSLQWRVWIQKLIKKKVTTLILCGRWPRLNMDVLPNNIAYCTSTVKLYLCFFKFPRITEGIQFPLLTHLVISHCLFMASDLESILSGCNKLSSLQLGYAILDVLRLSSDSLRFLHLWKCKVDFLCLSGTPVLATFLQEHELASVHRSHLQMHQIPRLRTIESIYLSQQTMEFCGYNIKADMLEYPMCSTITALGLLIDFSAQEELLLLPCLLRCFPELRSLKVFRFYSIQIYTGPAIDWHGMLSSIPCIRKTLNSFKLYHGCGDNVEKDLADVISECGTVLKKMQIELRSQFVR